MNAQSLKSGSSFKFASPDEAYRAARRRIVNNALRRKQISLDLSNFGLANLPLEIGQLTALQELNISDNQLATLPSEIGDLAALTRLDARSNKLVSLSDSMGRLRNLRFLYLQKNKIQELPRSIGALTKLRSLSLANNNLKLLPAELGSLTELTTLNLTGNDLTSLPVEIGRLQSLEELSLNFNRLSELPEGLTSLPALYRLDLDYNDLSSLPPQISGLVNLAALYLNGNKFSEFPVILGTLPGLSHLMLGSNQLSAIPAGISELRNLRSLYVANNLIRSVSPEIAYLKLNALQLSGNQLTMLPNELGTVSSLEEAAKTDTKPLTDGLFVEDNPLPDPYPLLIAPGQPTSTANVLAWLRGEFDPASLNSENKRAPERTPPSPPVPDEEAGPTFQLVDGQVDLVSTFEKSSEFDRAIQETLHRRLQKRVDSLYEASRKVSNQHPELLTVVDEYRKLIQPLIAELDIVDLWAVGNALMAQANSFQHQDKARTLSEPLEPSHLGFLTEVAALHGSFILGFPTAAQLTFRADRSRVAPEVIRTIGPPTSNVLSALSRQRRLLSGRARQLIEALDASLLAGSWDAARIGYTSYATVRNALVAIGRICIWINDKDGSLAGGAVIASAIAAANLSPDTLQLVTLFLKSNAEDILAFAAPFPELRTYVEWLINHFDDMEMPSKDSRQKDDDLNAPRS